jgi:alpha-D-xyloside xylohydrolase
VWKPGARSVAVHIPPGTWRNLWTGDTVRGPTTIEAEVPLHAIPAYVRVGSDLEQLDLSARWMEAQERARARPNLALLLQRGGW